MTRLSRRLVIFAALLVAGCVATPARDAIPPFHQAVVAADEQTAAALADVNTFLRRQQVERAIRQEALSEDLFFEALASADLAKWRRAFGLIASYAENLQRLLDPQQRSGVEKELSELGDRIGAVREEQLPTGISAAFTKLGGLLVQIKAEQGALEAVRAMDPAVQDIFRTMIETIGADSESGVRGTVRTSWTQLLARIDVKDFRRASSESGKRAAVQRYLEALDDRDLQDRVLASIRLTLVALAKGHSELAQGRVTSARTTLQLLQDEHKAYRKQVKTLEESRRKTGEET